MRLYMLNLTPRTSFVTNAGRLFLASILFFFFVAFTSMNYLLDYYQELLMISSSTCDVSTLSLFTLSKIISSQPLALNLVQVYTYPFIYVFLLVTVLSIVFCLTYNVDELFAFMFYCQTILLRLFQTGPLTMFSKLAAWVAPSNCC